jgi:outer membrane cobalamin receptor
VLVTPDSVRSVSDNNGKFRITLTNGPKKLVVTFVGYKTWTGDIVLDGDVVLNIEMSPETRQLDEVIISSNRLHEELVNSTRTSTNIITSRDIEAIPMLGGEADAIKTLQLLPGTLRGVEGSSDLFVRGGAADQNLVLLDGTPIYNTGHLLGFVSVFNPDVLEKVESINGGFPASFGGRLSSVLNVETRSEIAQATHGSADIGLIASRLFLEQPIVKDKASFWISGRRTYLDRVAKLAGIDMPYYFYDINAKLIVKPTRRDQLQISWYNGDDRLHLFQDRNNDGDGFLTAFVSGNNSQTLNWKRDLTPNWNSNLTAIRSVYRYSITTAFGANELQAFSNIQDVGGKWIIANDSLWGGTFSGGVDVTHHVVSPNVINTSGTVAELLKSSSSDGRVALEAAAFLHYERSLSKKLTVAAGFRESMAAVKQVNYFNPEPRIALRYSLGNNTALKASYSRMSQYMHRVSSSAVSSPTDIWYPVTDSIKPQNANVLALSFQRLLPRHNVFVSMEGYYKNMNRLIGYEEGTNLFFNTDFESKLIQGKGRAFGAELLVRKQAGKFTGWVSYTLSWSQRQFNEMNNGQWFSARYDRRHNGAVVGQYAIASRWAVSMVWEFISGSKFTPVIGQYAVTAPTLTGIDLIPVYAPLNSVKLSDTHRLDLGLKLKSKPGSRFHWQLFTGVYNVYNRTNPVAIVIETDEVTGVPRYSQPGLFGFLPFISYGFEF